MRYSIVHDGVPLGFVALGPGELVAGRLAPLAALDSVRPTIRSGSEALLTLGFFGAAVLTGQNDAEAALRAAAALRFDLIDWRGEHVPATFVNLIESPDGGVVVIARLSHSHAAVPATLPASARPDRGYSDPDFNDPAFGSS